MQQTRVNFIVTETTNLHNLVAEAYEALMDNEKKEANVALTSIIEKAKELKDDLLNKDV